MLFHRCFVPKHTMYFYVDKKKVLSPQCKNILTSRRKEKQMQYQKKSEDSFFGRSPRFFSGGGGISRLFERFVIGGDDVQLGNGGAIAAGVRGKRNKADVACRSGLKEERLLGCAVVRK